jgi:hypothetical protein
MLGALAAAVCSIASVEAFVAAADERVSPDVHRIVFAVASAIWGCGFLLVLWVAFEALRAGFRKHNRLTLLRTILASYVGLILIFAAIFYNVAFFGDYEDAAYKYTAYRDQALGRLPHHDLASQRAFNGINARFFSGVDWPYRDGHFPGGLPPGAYVLTAEEIRANALAAKTQADAVRFLPGERWSIFGDCLHLSVITIATLGYGDLTPRRPGARVATDLEAVCGQLIVVLALGMLFGNWWSDQSVGGDED